jgi:hypothetical protein
MKKIVARHSVIVFYIASILLAVILGLTNMSFFPSSFGYGLMFPQWSPALAIDNLHLYTVLYGMYAIAFAIPCIFIAKRMFWKKTIHKLPENAQEK